MKSINAFDSNANYKQITEISDFFENYIFRALTWKDTSPMVKHRFAHDICYKLSKLENLFFIAEPNLNAFVSKYDVKRAVHNLKESMTAYNMTNYLISCSESSEDRIFIAAVIGLQRAPIKYKLYEISDVITCRKIILDKLLYTPHF